MPIGADPSLHPHSAVTTPTFCLYNGNDPKPIVSIIVEQRPKDDDQRIEIMEWRRKLPWAASDQNAWILEYALDPSDPYQKPFTCITYGKAPPGYIEKIPAQPLIPERLYTVVLKWWGVVIFVIRTDSMGRPTHLEYAIDNPLPGARTSGVHVITRE